MTRERGEIFKTSSKLECLVLIVPFCFWSWNGKCTTSCLPGIVLYISDLKVWTGPVPRCSVGPHSFHKPLSFDVRFISHGGLASEVRKSNIDLNGLQIPVNMFSYSTKYISQETGKLYLAGKIYRSKHCTIPFTTRSELGILQILWHWPPIYSKGWHCQASPGWYLIMRCSTMCYCILKCRLYKGDWNNHLKAIVTKLSNMTLHKIPLWCGFSKRYNTSTFSAIALYTKSAKFIWI